MPEVPLPPPLVIDGKPGPGPSDAGDHRLIWWSLGGLISAFLLLALAWVLFADNIPWADADFYFRSAKSIADGDGYSHPFKSGNPPTAFHPVGYPWLLAHTWTLLGIDTGGCDVGTWPALDGCGSMIQAGQIVNVLLAALNIGLVFALAWLVRGPRIAIMAAFIFALIPSRFLFTSALMSEEAFVTLVLAALIMLVLGVRYQNWVLLTAVGFGLAVGAAAYVRPLGIVLLPLPLVLLFSLGIRPRIPFTQLAVGSVVAVVILLPWVIRTHNEVGGWSFVSNNGGINLWIGCHQDSNGKLASNGKWMDWWSGGAPAAINTSDERANDKEAQRLALQCMREEPVAFARLSLVKGLYTFREDWTYVGKWAVNYRLPNRPVSATINDGAVDALTYLSNSVYLVLVPLAVVGSVAVLFGPSVYRGLLGASFAVLAFIPLWFFGEPRFHVPLLPMMSIWAADGLLIVFRGLQSVGKETAAKQSLPAAPGLVVPYEGREEPWPR